MTAALACAAIAFLLSASAGLGGSLLLVPVLAWLLGPKQGVAVAALLLAGNNVAKVVAYRRTIPLRAVAVVLMCTVAGTVAGAKLLLAAPEDWVSAAVIAAFAATFVTERVRMDRLRRVSAPLLALCAGTTSGFSGTSGPLKGVALRSLGLDRLHLVGAASAVSLAGDVAKTAIFDEAGLLDKTSWTIVLAAIPLMPLAAVAGRLINRRVGEQAYAALFWAVMAGYSVRLLLR
jgi:uncharacterized membrane protein YfcA